MGRNKAGSELGEKKDGEERKGKGGCSIINRVIFLFYYFFRRLAYSPYTRLKNRSVKLFFLGLHLIPQ